jgi:threonine dehydrogenase-like Zn-dependent dehydrogenase
VAAVGAGVDAQWVGRRVASATPHAAYAVCSVTDAAVVPDGVSDDDATFTTLAAIAMNGVRRSKLTWGESVAVVGFALNRSEGRLKWLPGAPAIHGLAGEPRSLRTAIRNANGRQLVDVVFEVTGAPEAIAAEATLLREDGRLVILGSPRGASTFDFHDLCNAPSTVIIGAHNRSHPAAATPDNPWTQGRHAALFLQAVSSGALPVSDLVTHRLRYSAAAAAYALLTDRRSGAMGVVLTWQ